MEKVIVAVFTFLLTSVFSGEDVENEMSHKSSKKSSVIKVFEEEEPSEEIKPVTVKYVEKEN